MWYLYIYIWFKEALEESKQQYSELQFSVELQKNRFVEMQDAYMQEKRSHEVEKEKVKREKMEQEATFRVMEQNQKISILHVFGPIILFLIWKYDFSIFRMGTATCWLFISLKMLITID